MEKYRKKATNFCSFYFYTTKMVVVPGPYHYSSIKMDCECWTVKPTATSLHNKCQYRTENSKSSILHFSPNAVKTTRPHTHAHTHTQRERDRRIVERYTRSLCSYLRHLFSATSPRPLAFNKSVTHVSMHFTHWREINLRWGEKKRERVGEGEPFDGSSNWNKKCTSIIQEKRSLKKRKLRTINLPSETEDGKKK